MEMLDTKQCKDCLQVFPLNNFHKDVTGKQGVVNYCKPCKNNKYNLRRNSRRDYINNYERLRRYNLTQEEYNAMWEKQNFCCAICKTNKNNGKTWSIDHCHDSQKVRGILCDQCNLLLGHAKDNQEILSEAVYYLKENEVN